MLYQLRHSITKYNLKFNNLRLFIFFKIFIII